jgi:hypothetical protein
MKHLALALPLALGVALVACSQQSDTPLGYNPPAVAGSTAQGPYPRGQVTSATALNLATRGPRITVVSPARGAQLTAASVQVQVQVQTVNTVASVTIQGAAAQPLGNGIYEATVALVPGTNFIATVAYDNLGQKGESTFTVVQGTFQPLDQVLPSCLVACLSPGGLVHAEPFVNAAIAQLDLQQLLIQANPLVNASGFATIDALKFSSLPATSSIAGTTSGAILTVELDQVALLVNADVLGAPVTQAQATASSAIGNFQVVVNRDPAFLAAHGQLGLEVLSVGVTLQNLAIWCPNTIVNTALGVLQPQMVSLLSNEIGTALQGAVQSLLDGAQLAGVNTPLAVAVPSLAGSAQLGFELVADEAQGDAQGLSVGLGAEAVALAPLSTTATTQLYVTGAQPPFNAIPLADFGCFASVDAADALLQAYWLGGGMSISLDGTTQPSTLLTARTLYPFLPQVQQIAPDGDTPMIIQVSSQSPPLATFGGASAPFTITVGETQIEVLLDFCDGNPPVELFALRVPVELTATLSIQNATIQIGGLQAPVVSVDVVSEPVTPLDDLSIQNFLVQLLPFVLQQYSSQIPSIPIPVLPLGHTFSNGGIGFGAGWVEVWGDL